MSEHYAAIRRGIKRSFQVSWKLLRVFIPVSILTYSLKEFGILSYIEPYLKPYMSYFGLPGNAVLTLLVGLFNFVYAAIGTMQAIQLDARQITIIGVMVGIAHNVIVEAAILKEIKMVNWGIIPFRIIIALIAGYILNLILPQNMGNIEIISSHNNINEISISEMLFSVLKTSLKVIIILFVLNILYELVMIWDYRHNIKKQLGFVTKIMGFSEAAFTAWSVGFLIGTFYGIGIMYNLIKDGKLSHKDMSLVSLWINIAHAIIEDCYIFAIIGGNFFYIAFARVIIAFIIIRLISFNNFYLKLQFLGVPKP